MFESRWRFRPTEFALRGGALDATYADCWAGLKDRFAAMSRSIDATHDPALRSWVESANAADTDFPIQNLPFGRFRAGAAPTSRGASASRSATRCSTCALPGSWTAPT